MSVLADGTYLSVVVDPGVRGARRDRIIQAAVNGDDLDPDQAHLVRVIEYDVPDRDGNGTGELIVLLTTITDPSQARADELAAAYHQRWEEDTANDQLKTHLRGPGKVLRSRLPDLVHQEIWAWLIVHHAISVLISRAAEAADIDPDRISFTRVLRLVRRTATGAAAFPLSAGLRSYPPSWPTSPAGSTPPAVTAPAPAPSNAPATTTTASSNPANPPAPATTDQQPSDSTPPEQPTQLQATWHCGQKSRVGRTPAGCQTQAVAAVVDAAVGEHQSSTRRYSVAGPRASQNTHSRSHVQHLQTVTARPSRSTGSKSTSKSSRVIITESVLPSS